MKNVLLPILFKVQAWDFDFPAETVSYASKNFITQTRLKQIYGFLAFITK